MNYIEYLYFIAAYVQYYVAIVLWHGFGRIVICDIRIKVNLFMLPTMPGCDVSCYFICVSSYNQFISECVSLYPQVSG